MDEKLIRVGGTRFGEPIGQEKFRRHCWRTRVIVRFMGQFVEPEKEIKNNDRYINLLLVEYILYWSAISIFRNLYGLI